MPPLNQPRGDRGRSPFRRPHRRLCRHNEDADAPLANHPLEYAFSALSISGRTRRTPRRRRRRREASSGSSERRYRRRDDDAFEGLTQRLAEMNLQTPDAYDYTALREVVAATELEVLSGSSQRDRSLSPRRRESSRRRESLPRRETEAVSISRGCTRSPTDTPAPRSPQESLRLRHSTQCRERESFMRTPRERLEDHLAELEECWDDMEAGRGPPVPMTRCERLRSNLDAYEPLRRFFEGPGVREEFMRWYRGVREAQILDEEEQEAAAEAAEAAVYGLQDFDLAGNN